MTRIRDSLIQVVCRQTLYTLSVAKSVKTKCGRSERKKKVPKIKTKY
jgi:hypothetical protein